jgi:hypothetical protein
VARLHGWIALLAVIGLAGCASAGQPLSSTPTGPPPTPAPSPTETLTPAPTIAPTVTELIFPGGAYQVTITAQDAPPHPASLNGPWIFMFRPNQSFQIALGDEQVVTGTYTSHGADLTLVETGGPLACFHSSESWRSATYTWALNGGRLTLTTSDDPCPGRKLALTTHPLDPNP